MRLKKATVKDFWEHVRVMDPSNPNSCWLFEGPTDINGYGMYKGMLAHRIAAAIYLKQLPGKVVRNEEMCSNRLCVRKNHFDNVFFPTKRYRSSEVALRKRILAARGDSRYTVSEMAKKLEGVKIDRIKAVLREQAMYDILDDIEHYISENREVPIDPDTRMKVVTAV